MENLQCTYNLFSSSFLQNKKSFLKGEGLLYTFMQMYSQGIKFKFGELLSNADFSYKIPIQISRAVNYVIMLIVKLRTLMKKKNEKLIIRLTTNPFGVYYITGIGQVMFLYFINGFIILIQICIIRGYFTLRCGYNASFRGMVTCQNR